MVPVDHAGRIGFAADQRAHGFPLTADVISMLADEHVERSTWKSWSGSSPCPRGGQRDQRRLRRVGAPTANLAAQILECRSRRRTRPG